MLRQPLHPVRAGTDSVIFSSRAIAKLQRVEGRNSLFRIQTMMRIRNVQAPLRMARLAVCVVHLLFFFFFVFVFLACP